MFFLKQELVHRNGYWQNSNYVNGYGDVRCHFFTLQEFYIANSYVT